MQAVDPLANYYNELTKNYLKSAPPIPVSFSFAEDLSCRFEEEKFDIINCTNALDHTVAPMWALIEMCLILKKGGRIFLSHRKNEAVVENYEGFHQWNFDQSEDNGDLIFWNTTNKVNVAKVIEDFCTINYLTSKNDEYIVTVIEKFEHLPFDTNRYHRKLRACLLEAMLRI